MSSNSYNHLFLQNIFYICHLTEAVVETPLCASKARDLEALSTSPDSCSEETSVVVSASEELVLQKN